MDQTNQQPSDAAAYLRWLVLLVALGVAARGVRYAMHFPLWGDEAFVAANLIDRDLAGMAAPLDYYQVAPWGFLVAQWASVQWLGFNEYALRLFPLLAGCGALVLFARLASRAVPRPAALLAVGILAASYYPIRHSAECKQYASDLAAAVLLLATAGEYLLAESTRERRWKLALLLAAIPVAIVLSLPSIFVAGAVAAAASLHAWRKRAEQPATCNGLSRLLRTWAAPCAVAGMVAVSFVTYYAAFLGPVYLATESAGAMHDYWADGFPPLTHPLRLAYWLLDAHVGITFAYPNGGKHFGSLATLLLFIVGARSLWRRRDASWSVLLLGPFALGLIAAALQRYPYGAGIRLTVYLAPSICLLAGLGAWQLVQLASQTTQPRAAAAACSCLALLCIGMSVHAVIKPYKTIGDQRQREFDRALWRRLSDDRAVCLQTDWGLALDEGMWNWGHSAVYRCHRAMYGPPRDATSEGAIHAVAWSCFRRSFDEPERQLLERLSPRYRCVGVERSQVNEDDKFPSFYAVYVLEPLGETSETNLAERDGALR